MIAGAMAGAGVLAIPLALNESGWIGVGLLVVCGILSNITANLLGEVMFHMDEIRDYADLGEKAYGRIGRIVTTFTQYVTLTGISIIYLILFGMLLHEVDALSCVPAQFYSFIGGLLLAVTVIIFPTLTEVSFAGPLAVVSTATAAVVALVISIMFRNSPDYLHYHTRLDFNTKVVEWKSLWSAWSIFVFAFGGHSLLPNIYAVSRNRNEWWKSTNLAYNFVLCFLYLPIAIAVYSVYGSFLGTNTQVLAILGDPKFGTQYETALMVATVLLVVHLISILPITTNPVMSKLESIILDRDTPSNSQGSLEGGITHGAVPDDGDDLLTIHHHHKLPSSILQRIIIRTPGVAFITIIAVFFPYFLAFIALVTSLSVMCDVYIFPALISWKLSPSKTRGKKVLLIFLVLFGVVGSVSGFYEGIVGFIADVKANPSPWKGMFTFSCK